MGHGVTPSATATTAWFASTGVKGPSRGVASGMTTTINGPGLGAPVIPLSSYCHALSDRLYVETTS